jgi:magnesium chelatase subunit I
MEHLISSAERRAIINGETETTARITDVYHIVPAMTGKLELVYEGEQEGAINVARHLIGRAVKERFTNYFPDPAAEKKQEEESKYQRILDWFAAENELELTDQMSGREYTQALNQVDGLRKFVEENGPRTGKKEQSVMMDIVIEALHQHSMLGKEDLENTRSYTDMLGSMLGSVDNFDDFDDFER